MSRTTGETLIRRLEAQGVDTVFGIPGVHTVELYRGLAASPIRHVTPRHEQGAGFMADGYARASGKPGVALVITGPGLTNTLTPMAQARADSVPMLVVSGVNVLPSLGKGLGHLHELPDQSALAAGVALDSARVTAPEELIPAVDAAFARMAEGRPGPTHIEVPLDIAGREHDGPLPAPPGPVVPTPSDAQIAAAAERLRRAERPVILAGGGATAAAEGIRALAERLDAPVVLTTNARGIMHGHPLVIPASPSLDPVRELIGAADCVLAIGTELGQTDYDMYCTGAMPDFPGLIRLDICAGQLARHPAELKLQGAAAPGVAALLAALADHTASPRQNAECARLTRERAYASLTGDQQAQIAFLNAARDALPGALMVGDSTQLIYAGNLYYDHDRAGGWFNAATGYGALGYGIPAAIGAALACPDAPVLCITGDGGAQFVLPELMTAVDENLPVIFLVWNNSGYGEIAVSMEDVGIEVVGCSPTPPDFEKVADSCGMPYALCPHDSAALGQALRNAAGRKGPSMIEIRTARMTRKTEADR
ncbi:5-guanidino-2-oxopentanoate decarboxylase [Sulfitobacter aestuarii]|uniref:5-guanidino-2-oxopentanoate decarboxylase n=1 Tax=Sulfitobacter aestuarii TaxID=2161676 RepID=A0ABW5U447_9RHOB